MKDNPGREKKIRKSFTISPYIAKMISLKSKEEGASESCFVENVIGNYLAKDVPATDTLLYRFDQMKKEMQKHDTKLEELCVLFMDYLHFFFRTQPVIELNNESEIKKSKANVKKFLLLHKELLKKKPPFLFQIFGDMLEEDDNGYILRGITTE